MGLRRFERGYGFSPELYGISCSRLFLQGNSSGRDHRVNNRSAGDADNVIAAGVGLANNAAVGALDGLFLAVATGAASDDASAQVAGSRAPNPGVVILPQAGRGDQLAALDFADMVALLGTAELKGGVAGESGMRDPLGKVDAVGAGVAFRISLSVCGILYSFFLRVVQNFCSLNGGLDPDGMAQLPGLGHAGRRFYGFPGKL